MTLTPERWQQVKQLFTQALAQPAGQRLAWVARVAGDDTELHREVTSLLDALQTAHDRLERPPAFRLGPLLDDTPSDPLPLGSRFGPYRLLRPVGRGGMGIVYEAHRDDDPYAKRVAIKTISRGHDSAAILQRFRQERQILARLEHRNIAALLDGGVAEGGQPYLAMEFVEGDPIDRYCEARRLGLTERLQLVRQVCGAVQHAHRNLVIHRDLKPSNILVTGDGTVKLLDFGIAKLLDQTAGVDPATVTQVGGAPLTAAYASPEQLAGAAVTTATDIWSLGVVLYELLAGSPPFHHDRPGPEELRRRIREQPPLPPSQVVLERSEPALTAAERRQRSRPLRGDLDSIVLMALRHEPARRYASAEQLGEDLRRVLAGQPVLAQPDALGYRVGKFVRRNRGAVAAGALAVVALVAGFAATAWQARVAAGERDRARAAASRAEQVSGFLRNMLGAADPSWYSSGERPGPQTTIGEIFETAGRRAEAELAGDPAVLADVLHTLGRANQALRRPEEAIRQLTRAHELHRASAGAASGAAARDEHELGMAWIQQGDLGVAERWLRQSLATFHAARDTLSDDFNRTQADLGLVLSTSGRPAEAEPLIRAAAARRRQFEPDGAAHAILLGNLGLVLSQQGKLAEAEPFYREALAAFDRMTDREYFEKGYTLGNLAVDLLVRRRTAEARPLAEAQVAHFTRLLGPDHPTTGYGHINVARVLLADGDAPGALRAGRTAERIFRNAVPDGHPDLARAELVLGQAARVLGDRVEAERRLRLAWRIRADRLAPESPHTAEAAAALGDLLVELGRGAEAESLLVNAERRLRAGLGADDPRTRGARESVVRLYERAGRSDAARAWRDSLRDTAVP